MKKNCLKSILSLALVTLGLAMPKNAMAAWNDGHTPSSVAVSTTDITSVTDASKICYLYNVNTGQFLQFGGTWGTEAALDETGCRCILVGSDAAGYKIICENGYLSYVYGGSWDRGIFSDRESSQSNVIYNTWKFSAPSSSAATTFNILTQSTCPVYYTTSFRATTATNASVYLGQNQSTTTGRSDLVVAYYYGSSTYHYLDANAESMSTLTSDKWSDADELLNGTWRIVTQQDLIDHFGDVYTSASADNPIDASFVISDPFFARKNDYISSWNWTYDGSTNAMTNYTNYDVTANFANYGYTIGLDNLHYAEGNTYSKDEETMNQENGQFYNLQIGGSALASSTATEKTDKTVTGVLAQTVTVPVAGTYMLSCQGYCQDDEVVYLYATNASGETTQIQLKNVSYLTSGAPTNQTEAGEAFSMKAYLNSVLVTVPEGTTTLTIGINATNTDGTFVKDFQLKYVGTLNGYGLYLDEDATDLTYLTGTNYADGQQGVKARTYINRVLYLHRNFTKGAWNTFVCPVSLTKKQVQQICSNIVVAQCVGITEQATKITFHKLDLSAMSESATVIEPNQTYLVYIDATDPVTAEKTLTWDTPTAGTTQTVTIAPPYYMISGVSLSTEEQNNNFENAQILTNVTESQVSSGVGIQVVGTLTKVADMADWLPYYAMSKNNMYYFSVNDEKTRSMKGFRSFFRDLKYDEESGWAIDEDPGAKSITVEFVDDEATGIENVVINGNQSAKANNNVYSINGQLIRSNSNSAEGLAKGVYIVGGKKYVVK